MQVQSAINGHRGRVDPAATGRDGLPWPEFLQGAPALVVPQIPDHPRVIDPAQGWSGAASVAELRPANGWLLRLQAPRVAITCPDGLWFDGDPLLTRDWVRAARARGGVVLVSGLFATIDQFPAAAAAGALRFLGVRVSTVPASAAGPEQVLNPGEARNALLAGCPGTHPLAGNDTTEQGRYWIGPT